MKNSQSKPILLSAILASLFLFAGLGHAGLYKGLDDEGNVVYSDTPFHNAEKITPPAITVVQPTKVPPEEKVAEEDKTGETKYTKFLITAPKNDDTIWNEPQLMVSLRLKPSLDTKSGHRIWLLMDGKPLVKNSQSLSLPIGRADRGSHSIQAQIRNPKGKILSRTKPVTIHIKNTVVPRKAPR